MVLRLLAETAGIALILVVIAGAIQCLEWGLDPVEPDDSFELPNSVDLRVQGAGAGARRARALERELELERWSALEPAR